MSLLKGVLFDAGGTLFRVRGSVGLAYATVAARHSVRVSAADLESRFRAAFGGMPPLSFPGTPEDDLPQHEYAWWREVASQVFSGFPFRDFDAFFHDLFEYFADAAAWELFPDTRPALAALQARGLRLGVVSNFDGRLPAICAGLGIADAFDTIVMSGRAGSAKPDPRIFATALDLLRLRAGECLHVGDSETEDVAGAQAAGMRAVLVHRGTPSEAATNRVSDLRELVDQLLVRPPGHDTTF